MINDREPRAATPAAERSETEEGGFDALATDWDPERYAAAIVKAATHYDNPDILVEVSTGLGEPMRGQSLGEIPPEERLAVRGW